MSETTSLWDIPYQRNPFFTGREDILDRLERALDTDQRVALLQPTGISALEGISKTQTVVEYAYRHRSNYPLTQTILEEYNSLRQLLMFRQK